MSGQADPVVPFFSGQARALRVIHFLWLTIALEFFAIAAGLMDVRSLVRYSADQPLPQSYWAASELRLAATGWSQGIVYLATAILFLMWFHRAYRNLVALGARGLRWTPGGAVVTFFVPLMNLVRPLLATMDLWRASDPNAVDWRRASVSPLLVVWWVCWITSDLVESAPAWTDAESATPGELRLVAWIGMGGAVLSIVAAVLVIRIIQTINARQEQKARQLSEAPGPPLG